MRPKARGRAIILAASLAALPLPSFGAEPGEVLWNVETGFHFVVPSGVTAPDGSVYFHSEEVLALAPDGTVLWRDPLPGASVVDRAADGTVYAAAGDRIVAYRTDGVRLWTFVEDPAGSGFMAGPNVGPDGNVYAVTETQIDGLGAFSLTPAGALRWSIAGFEDHQAIGFMDRRLEFASDRFYFAHDLVPLCESTGMVAILLSGAVDWCRELAGHSVVTVGLQDRAHVASLDLRTFDSEGGTLWTASLIQPGEPATGPREAVFLTHSVYDLSAIRPDGSLLWTVEDAANGRFPVRPTVSPDGSVVLLPSSLAFGSNGELRAFDAADGSLLWSLALTGDSAGAAGPAVFGPHGMVAYLPVTTRTATTIVAVQVRGATIFADGFESGDVSAWDAVSG